MNVILVAIDTLRADHLSCYGYKKLTSPHIDKVARQGVIFENFISPHIPTHPGFTTMMTGVDVMRHQIVCQSGDVELDDKIKTLPEILNENGYFTIAADNMEIWFKRGFEVYEGYEWEIDTYEWRKAEAVNSVALKQLKFAYKQNRPFFCFLHYWEPHTPYLPPKPFDRMFYGKDETAPEKNSMEPVLNFPPFAKYFRQWMGHVTDIEFPRAQYDGAIAYCDATLAVLFQRLDELGLTENTALIIVSDHGEELDEHGCWFDHHGLYETNLHVPLIIRCPDKIPPNSRVSGMANMLDFAPTVLDLVGMKELALEHKMMGKSLLPLLNSPEKGTRDFIFLTESSWMRKRGIRTAKWKYIQSCEPDIHGFPPIELYELESDSEEQHNLAKHRPKVVKEMHNLLNNWVSQRMKETGHFDPLETQGISLREVGNQKIPLPPKKKYQSFTIWLRDNNSKLEVARLIERELRKRKLQVEFFDQKVVRKYLSEDEDELGEEFKRLAFIISILESINVISIVTLEPEHEEIDNLFRTKINRLLEVSDVEKTSEYKELNYCESPEVTANKIIKRLEELNYLVSVKK